MPFGFSLVAVLRRLLVVRSGFWDCDEVYRYHRAMRIALEDSARSCGIVDVLIDLSFADVLAPGPADRMRPVAALLRDGPTRKVAWVTGSALGRMQVRPVVEDVAKFGMFASPVEAEEWFAAA